MADPLVTLIGTITGTSGGSVNYPNDVNTEDVILVVYIGTGGISSVSDGSNVFVFGNMYALCERVTTFKAAGSTLTVTFTPNSNQIPNKFVARVYHITGVTTRPSRYSISDAGANLYGAFVTSSFTTSYSNTANVDTYLASRSVPTTKVGKSVAIAVIGVGFLSGFTFPIGYTETAGDSYTALFSEDVNYSNTSGTSYGGSHQAVRMAYDLTNGRSNGQVVFGTDDSSPSGESVQVTVVHFVFFAAFTSTSTKIDCKRDEENGRRYVAAISSTGNAVIYLDDIISTSNVSALTPVTVDSATDCSSPNIKILKDKSLIYTYSKSGNIYFRKSTNLGATWSAAIMIVSGFTTHDLGSDLADFFPVISAYRSSDSKLCIITGTSDGSGGVTWNSPVSTGITIKEVSPALHIRNDGTFEITYVDASSNIIIIRSNNLKPDGTGTWA